MKKSFLLLLLLFSVYAQGAGCLSDPSGKGSLRIRISTEEGVTLTATLIDNATARALFAKLPMTIPLTDLYAREMCYHFPEALPTDDVRTSGYEIGEIIYWPPRHSFVIMYEQNGERFDMQKLGCVDSGVEFFKKAGDITVTLEKMP
jgi:hypothetical protein